MQNKRLLVGLIGAVVILAACGRDRSAPTNTPLQASLTASITITSTAMPSLPPDQRPTLPPSWTPPPTRTPLPTFTPTKTPTALPTFTAKQICDNFRVVSAPQKDPPYAFDDTVNFMWQGIPPDTQMFMLITHSGDSQPGLRLEIPVGGDGVLPFPLTRLPSEGDYEWKIWLQHKQYGEICGTSGTFKRKPAVLV